MKEMRENQIVIYKTNDGQTAIDVRMENETVWLTQAQMAMLFQKDQSRQHPCRPHPHDCRE